MDGWLVGEERLLTLRFASSTPFLARSTVWRNGIVHSVFPPSVTRGDGPGPQGSGVLFGLRQGRSGADLTLADIDLPTHSEVNE